MELAQLHEAGSSQAEQRTAAEEGVEAARRKVEDLEDVVREQTTMYEEANGEPRDAVERGGWVGASFEHVGRLSLCRQARVYTQIVGPSSSSLRAAQLPLQLSYCFVRHAAKTWFVSRSRVGVCSLGWR